MSRKRLPSSAYRRWQPSLGRPRAREGAGASDSPFLPILSLPQSPAGGSFESSSFRAASRFFFPEEYNVIVSFFVLPLGRAMPRRFSTAMAFTLGWMLANALPVRQAGPPCCRVSGKVCRLRPVDFPSFSRYAINIAVSRRLFRR